MQNVQNNDFGSFSQMNAFAMQHGVVLGAVGILTMACSVLSLTYDSANLVFWFLLILSFVVARRLTMRYRDVSGYDLERGFPFSKAFAHTFLMGLYAGLWVALATFVYLQWFDHGHVFTALEAQLSRPEMLEAFRQTFPAEMLDVESPETLPATVVSLMRASSPASHAIGVLYMNLFAAPVVSAVIALLSFRRPQHTA